MSSSSVFSDEVEFASRKWICKFNNFNSHNRDKTRLLRQAMQLLQPRLPTQLDAMLVPRKMRALITPTGVLFSMSLTPEAIKTLSGVSTATITTVLLKKGLRNIWMRGSRPLRPGQPRLVGPAFTLRFVPAREDLATPESWSSPISTRTAIEAMPQGCIAVIDAMGVSDAGFFGDILCARMVKRGVAGLVSDGVVRDLEGVLGTGLPVWCDGFAAPPSVAGLTFVGWGEPIGCGGVAIFPEDIIVADQDGAVVIPKAFLDLILAEGAEQERMEAWIVDQVNGGAALPGLYPMNADTKARYAATKK